MRVRKHRQAGAGSDLAAAELHGAHVRRTSFVRAGGVADRACALRRCAVERFDGGAGVWRKVRIAYRSLCIKLISIDNDVCRFVGKLHALRIDVVLVYQFVDGSNSLGIFLYTTDNAILALLMHIVPRQRNYSIMTHAKRQEAGTRIGRRSVARLTFLAYRRFKTTTHVREEMLHDRSMLSTPEACPTPRLHFDKVLLSALRLQRVLQEVSLCTYHTGHYRPQ